MNKVNEMCKALHSNICYKNLLLFLCVLLGGGGGEWGERIPINEMKSDHHVG